MSIYIALDFETTGLDHSLERITQIAAIKIEIEGTDFLPATKMIKMSQFETLVNPEKEISAFITGLTGIDNEKVKDAPKEKEAIQSLINFMGDDAIIIAQNAPFDLGFLHHATLRADQQPKVYNFYCTRAMAAILFPGISHKLVDLVKLFDIPLEEAHNAIYDAQATLNLFLKLNTIASKFEVNFLNKLVNHPDRKMNFEPQNKIIIPLQKR